MSCRPFIFLCAAFVRAAKLTLAQCQAGQKDHGEVEKHCFGGGVEGMLADDIGVRGEYTYTMYEDIDVIPGVNVDPDQHLIRVGIAYYF